MNAPTGIRIKTVIPSKRRHEECPWNPFPRGSEWGDKIDALYRRDLARKKFGKRSHSYGR